MKISSTYLFSLAYQYINQVNYFEVLTESKYIFSNQGRY